MPFATVSNQKRVIWYLSAIPLVTQLPDWLWANLLFDKTGREIFCIGKTTKGLGVFLTDGVNREEITFQGYDHFKD